MRDMLTAAIANVLVSEEERMISWGSAKEYIYAMRGARIVVPVQQDAKPRLVPKGHTQGFKSRAVRAQL
jgi:hypothetical protein